MPPHHLNKIMGATLPHPYYFNFVKFYKTNNIVTKHNEYKVI